MHSPPRPKRYCRGKKHASMYSIMGIGVPIQAECSIHDFDIDNMNRVFCESAARIVNGCTELGIFFL